VAIEFVKGHGTQNDFVLLPDPSGRLELTPDRIADLCDRQRGLGADGILRVVRVEALGEVMAAESKAEWFMDYRNADGSSPGTWWTPVWWASGSSSWAAAVVTGRWWCTRTAQ